MWTRDKYGDLVNLAAYSLIEVDRESNNSAKFTVTAYEQGPSEFRRTLLVGTREECEAARDRLAAALQAVDVTAPGTPDLRHAALDVATSFTALANVLRKQYEMTATAEKIDSTLAPLRLALQQSPATASAAPAPPTTGAAAAREYYAAREVIAAFLSDYRAMAAPVPEDEDAAAALLARLASHKPPITVSMQEDRP